MIKREQRIMLFIIPTHLISVHKAPEQWISQVNIK